MKFHCCELIIENSENQITVLSNFVLQYILLQLHYLISLAVQRTAVRGGTEFLRYF